MLQSNEIDELLAILSRFDETAKLSGKAYRNVFLAVNALEKARLEQDSDATCFDKRNAYARAIERASGIVAELRDKQMRLCEDFISIADKAQIINKKKRDE
jgi:hypothetical protein